jgi:hypothetical protein
MRLLAPLILLPFAAHAGDNARCLRWCPRNGVCRCLKSHAATWAIAVACIGRAATGISARPTRLRCRCRQA